MIEIPLLAVDGGGTKSLAMLLDQDRTVLGQGASGGCNHQTVGKAEAKEQLRKAIASAVLELATKKAVSGGEPLRVSCAVFGIAGLDTGLDRAIITDIIHQVLTSLNIHVRHLVVENDGFMTLLGATRHHSGILVISGTGSIVYGMNETSQFIRSSGWGHMIGDEGSGYWIGKQALNAVFKMADGRGEFTLLHDKVLSFLELNDIEELCNWIYGADYSVDRTADLARLVNECAAEGDDTAKRILEEAARELLVAAQAVISRLGLTDAPCQLFLHGGVLDRVELIRSKLIAELQNFAPALRYVPKDATFGPLSGIIFRGFEILERGYDQ
jgi:N-acetylglucosamine kinase-like BadF-type ATPase